MNINGLDIDTSGNVFIVLANDHEGSDKVEELNLALHVIEVLKGRIESGKIETTYARHRFYVEAANGSLMSVSETKQAIKFMQKTLQFS